MTTDPTTLARTAVEQLPFNRLVGLHVVEAAPGRALTRLAPRAELLNHIGTLHAGALFALAEAASGAVVAASLADVLGRGTPLAVNVQIQYKTPAPGECHAEATLDEETLQKVRGDVQGARRTAFDVGVRVSSGEQAVAVATVRWIVLPAKSSATDAAENALR